MAKTRVALLGCGYTGIALGLAIKAAIKDVEIVGNDKDREALKRAEQAKAIDRGEWNIPKACENAAAIFISAPPDEHEIILKAIGQDAQSNTLIATVGPANTTALRLASAHVPTDVPFFATSIVFHPDRVPANTESSTHALVPAPDSMKSAIWTMAPRPGTTPQYGRCVRGTRHRTWRTTSICRPFRTRWLVGGGRCAAIRVEQHVDAGCEQ